MTDPRVTEVEQLLARVRSEFFEMPGLTLTAPQAGRLLGLDEPTCRQILQGLVDSKFLNCAAGGRYARP